MGLFDNGILGGGGIAQAAKEVGQPQDTKASGGDAYRKPMSVGSFDEFGADLVAGKPVELARWTAPAGIARRWGYGSAEFEANEGYAYGVLNNASGEQIHASITYSWENSTGRETQVVDELDSQDMDTTDRYNRDSQVPMPEDTSKNRANRDEHLIVLAEPITDAADITNNFGIDAGTSEVRWPTTEYDVS